LRGFFLAESEAVVIPIRLTREEPLQFDSSWKACVLVEAKAVEKILPPQGTTPELHEAAGCPDWVAHQLHEMKLTDRVHRLILREAGHETRIEQEQAESAEPKMKLSATSKNCHEPAKLLHSMPRNENQQKFAPPPKLGKKRRPGGCGVLVAAVWWWKSNQPAAKQTESQPAACG